MIAWSSMLNLSNYYHASIHKYHSKLLPPIMTPLLPFTWHCVRKQMFFSVSFHHFLMFKLWFFFICHVSVQSGADGKLGSRDLPHVDILSKRLRALLFSVFHRPCSFFHHLNSRIPNFSACFSGVEKNGFDVYVTCDRSCLINTSLVPLLGLLQGTSISDLSEVQFSLAGRRWIFEMFLTHQHTRARLWKDWR